MRPLMFVRSGPLNVTPAVERYATFLRTAGCTNTFLGLELDYGAQRPPVRYVDRLLSMPHSFAGTRERIAAVVSWQVYQTRRLLSEKPDVVQYCDVFSVFPALIAKAAVGSRLIFDIRDVAKLAVSHRGRVVTTVLGAIEALGAIASDAVVVVDEPLLSALPKAVRRRAFVVPNTPNTDVFDGFRFGSAEQLRVNLAGFISFRRNLAAWLEVRSRRSEVQLDMYGSIADERTRGMLEEHGISSVEKVAYREALERSRDCDVVSLMYDPTIGINRFAAPNKYYEALALGKPVICAQGMGLSREVEDAGCGYAIPYGDVDALEAVVVSLLNPELRRTMGERARDLFKRRYMGRAEREMRRLYESTGVLNGSIGS